jgi:UDPglucose 6-dehydrogenase
LTVNLVVVGLGKLGSCLAAVLGNAGHVVTGIDSNQETCARFFDGNPEPGFADLDLTLAVVSDPRYIAQADMSFVIVPTPSLPSGAFDDSFLLSALRDVGKWAKSGHVCVIVSTVSPGTMRKLSAVMQSSNVELVYSPLFVALGSVVRDLRSPDFRLIGTEHKQSAAAQKVAKVLASIDSMASRTAADTALLSWEEAEIAKLSVNAYIVQKIAFANMIAAACAQTEHADARNILAAVGRDRRIGTAYLKPGAPPSGPCFPRDSVALAEFLERVAVDSQIPRAVTMFNNRQVGDAVLFFDPYKTVAILGLSYKPGTAVTDESLGVKVAEFLASTGHCVLAHDPKAKVPIDCNFVNDLNRAMVQADAVLIATPHPEYNGIDTLGKPTLDPWMIAKSKE